VILIITIRSLKKISNIFVLLIFFITFVEIIKIMTLKEQIQKDFISSMKNKDEITKSTLSGLKAKITEGEKVNGTELSDADVLKVINKGIKQREESIRLFIDGGRPELAVKESEEMLVLKNYLPAQMTNEEIETAVREIIVGLPVMTNSNALSGRTMGEFNKKYQGKADSKIVSEIIKKVVG
jgi:uncharacterized protein YqeY